MESLGSTGKMGGVEDRVDGVAFKPYLFAEWQSRGRATKSLNHALVVVAVILLIAAALYATDLLPWKRNPNQGSGHYLLLIVFNIVVLPLAYLMQIRGRLVIDSHGVKETGLFGTSWSIAWSEIVDIRLTFGPTIAMYAWHYQLKGKDGQLHKIIPLQWAVNDVDSALFPRPAAADWVNKPGIAREYLERSRLHEKLGKPPVEDDGKRPATVGDFARTKRGKAIFALAAIAAIYAFLDWSQYARYRILDDAFLWVAGIGILAFAASGFLLMWGRSGNEKAIGVVLMLMPGFFAPAPLALRVNALTDLDGPRLIEYRLLDDMLVASGDGPAIAPHLYRRLASGRTPAEEQELRIYRGMLGFHQLDLESIEWRH